MRKLIYLSLACGLLLSGCKKESAQTPPADGKIKLQAVVSQEDITKVIVNEKEGGLEVLWKKGDPLSVFSTTTKTHCGILKASNEGKTASFIGEITDPKGNIYVLSPGNESLQTATLNSIPLNVEGQTVADNTTLDHLSNYLCMAGSGTVTPNEGGGYKAAFNVKHLCSVLKLNVKLDQSVTGNVTLKSVTVSGSGLNSKVILDGQTGILTAAEGSSNDVKLTYTTPLALSQDTPQFVQMVVFATAGSGEITLTFVVDVDGAEQTATITTDSKEFKAGVRYVKDNVVLKPEPEIEEPADLNKTAKTATITKRSELAWVAAMVNTRNAEYGFFSGWTLTQGNDIDLENKPWTPIGTSSAMNFMGTYNGGNHEIQNINVNLPGQDYVGLFGITGRATIQSVVLASGSVIGESVGGIVGFAVSSSIIGCSNYASVVCSNRGGGIVGYSDAQVIGCENYGEITCSNSEGGGVLGYAGEGDVIACINHGTVNGKSIMGGVMGRMFASGKLLYACINEGLVKVTSNVGGVAGVMNDYKEVKNIYFVNNAGLKVTSFDNGSSDPKWTTVGPTTISALNGKVNDLNATIKAWNASNGDLCAFHFVASDTPSTNIPTLEKGAPQ